MIAAEDQPPSSLWRNHDFTILWCGQSVSALGSSMSFFLFPLVGYYLSHSATLAALPGTAFALGRIAIRLPAGAIVDRHSRRAVLLVADLTGAIIFACVALALVIRQLTIPELIAAALLTGVAGVLGQPAEQAAVRAVVPLSQRASALSRNEARENAATLIGPPLGGLLYSAIHWLPFVLDSVSYTLSFIATTRLKTRLKAPRRDRGAPGGLKNEIQAGLRFLWLKGVFRAVAVFSAIVNFATTALFLIVTLKLARASVHPADIGLIYTAGSVGGLTGAIATPSLMRLVPNGALAIMASVVVLVAITPMALTNSPLIIGALLAAALFWAPASNTITQTYLMAVTPDELQGRVSAALGFFAGALIPLAPITGGVLLSLLGSRSAMLCLSGLLILGVIALFVSKDLRQLPTMDRWSLQQAGILPDERMATNG